MSSITQREDDWKTDAICNLLYCQPSITRNEVVRAIEESMTRVQSLRFFVFLYLYLFYSYLILSNIILLL